MPPSRRALATLAAATALALAACGSPSTDTTGQPTGPTTPEVLLSQEEASVQLQADLEALSPAELSVEHDDGLGALVAGITLSEPDEVQLSQALNAWAAAKYTDPAWIPDSQFGVRAGVNAEGGDAFVIGLLGWPKTPDAEALTALPDLYASTEETGLTPSGMYLSLVEGEPPQFFADFEYDYSTDWYPLFLEHLDLTADATSRLGVDPENAVIRQGSVPSVEVPMTLAGTLDDPALADIFVAISEANLVLGDGNSTVMYEGCAVVEGPAVSCSPDDVDSDEDEAAVAALRETVEAAGVAWAGE